MGNRTSPNPLVLFHKDCADGFGAAFAAWLKFGDEAEYVPMQYGKIDFDFEGGFFNLGSHEADNPCTFIAGRDVYILDFSFPRPIMDAIFRNAKHVWWFDHHKSAFEMWLGRYEKGDVHICNRYGPTTRCEIILNDNKSGALLSWQFFHPGTEVPLLIRHIDDYDRWVFALRGTEAFQKALWSYAPWSFEQWKELCERATKIDGDEYAGWPYYQRMLDEGDAILRAHEQNVQSVVKGSARNCEIPFDEEDALDCVEPRLEWNNGGYWMVHGLAANCPPHLQSDVGHELANQSGTFGLLWTLDKDNVCRCSLRSNGDCDVSAIAKAFGGGGHRNAAGFTIDIQTLLGWIR